MPEKVGRSWVWKAEELAVLQDMCNRHVRRVDLGEPFGVGWWVAYNESVKRGMNVGRKPPRFRLPTAEEIAVIREKYFEGVPTPKIAALFRHYNLGGEDIEYIAEEQGWKRPRVVSRNHRWTKEEKSHLEALWLDEWTTRDIARDFGLSVWQIGLQAQKQGLSSLRKKPQTEKELNDA